MESKRFLFTSTFFPPYHLGGDAINVYHLGKELVSLGHEVHVFHNVDAYTFKRGKKVSSSLDPEGEGINVHSFKSSYDTIGVLGTYITGTHNKILSQFSSIASSTKPEVIHHHNISLLGFPILLERGSERTLATAHDYWIICQRNDLSRFDSGECHKHSCFFCALYSKRAPQLFRNDPKFEAALKGPDLYIAPSEYMKEQLDDSVPKPVVHLPYFIPPLAKGDDVSLSRRFFLFVGVLENHKGIMELLDSYCKSEKELEQDLAIIGTGSLEREIHQTIESAGLSKRVSLLGWQNPSTLGAYYTAADALIVPSMWAENFPFVILEAISCGTPVIASERGGIPEVVGQIDPSLVVKDNELGEAMIGFDGSKYTKDSIKKIYLDNYTPEIIMKRYLDLIEKGSDTESQPY